MIPHFENHSRLWKKFHSPQSNDLYHHLRLSMQIFLDSLQLVRKCPDLFTLITSVFPLISPPDAYFVS